MAKVVKFILFNCIFDDGLEVLFEQIHQIVLLLVLEFDNGTCKGGWFKISSVFCFGKCLFQEG